MSETQRTIHDMANLIFSEAIKKANADQFDEAVGIYGNLIDLRAALTNAYQQRGRCHWEMRRWAEALKDFEQSSMMEPNNDDFAWTLGLMHLQQHNYKQGWEGYARRWGSRTFKSPRLRTNKPEWYPGCGAKKILVWPEQGLGDQIIYSSMLPLLAQHGDVTVMIDMRLVNLLQRGMPNIKFIPHDSRLPFDSFDAHIPLGSLGQHFIHSKDDIRNVERHYIAADPARVNDLKNKYKFKDRSVFGLSWQSTAKTVGKHKSCTLKDLEPVLEWGRECGYQFVSLQYGDVSELDKYPHIIRPTEHLFFDLESVAALMHCCEHIISVSNVNVHIAGAMGAAVSMLDANKLWYWNAKDENGFSDWYWDVLIYPREHMLAPWTNQVRSMLKYLEEQY